MLRRPLIAFAFVTLLGAACTPSQGTTVPSAPVPSAVQTIAVSPSHEPAAVTATGSVQYVSNLRTGPDTAFPIVDSVEPGEQLTITACDTDCSWYQVDSGAWIRASLVQFDTSAAFIPHLNANGQALSNSLPALQPDSISASPQIPLIAAPPAPALAGQGEPGTLTMVGWNVESGGSDPATIADRMAGFERIDLWGLSEVDASASGLYEQGAEFGEGANYEQVLGTTGGGDRLLILYDATRFTLIESRELHAINPGGNVRSPLYVHLKDQETGTEFLFMVNHLYRSSDAGRHEQARLLNDWAESQTLPIIAVGDYNFDWNPTAGVFDHDVGYDYFTQDNVFVWVQPPALATTQCSGWPCSYQSVLDFVFVANDAQNWPAASDIVFVANDFPDNETTSDHRPVRAVIDLP